MKTFKNIQNAFVHLTHGIFPFIWKERIHSKDDGDPTPRQEKILEKTGDNYLTHFLLNIFLAFNHLSGTYKSKVPVRLSKKSRKSQRQR